MALVVKDRVKEITTTTGTADFTLGGAVLGYQSFSVIGNTNTTYYACSDSVTGDWEVGIGTYSTTGPTLTRTTVLESSNAGSKVNFAAGSKDIFVTYPAERSVYLDTAGSAVTLLDVGTLGVGVANITTANITSGTVSTTPASGTDIANKTYVDTLVSSGITYHTAVKYEVPNTTGNLTATYNNGTAGVGATLTNNGTLAAFAPDGPTASPGDRILIYNQTNGFENGVYTVTTVGSGSVAWVLTRATDADSYGLKSPNALGEGDAFYVTSGNTGAGETYVCNTQGTITFGTTAITFTQVSSAQVYSAGTGLTLTNTTFSITPVGTASTYGSASQVPVITTNASGQVSSVTNTSIAISAGAVSGLAASATTDTTDASNISSGTLPNGRLNGSYTGVTGTGTLTAGTWNATTIAAAYGGTGQTTYTIGDILYASGSSALSKLADVAYGSVLLSGGVATAPSYGKVSLTDHITGTLAVANGGTGATTLTGYVYGNGTGAFTASASIPNSATTATSANTASAIVARDASGNFSAGTITATLSGNASTATSATTATTATNQSGGTVNATTGSFSGVITSTVASGTAINLASQSDSIGYNTTAGLGTYIKGTGSTYIYGGGMFYDGSAQRTILTSGNYNSYAPTLTGTGASGTWSINVTGSAGSATTLTNFTATTAGSGFNPDSPPSLDQIGYWTGGYTLYGYSDGGLYTAGYSTSWYHQIAGDFRTGQIAVRGKNSGTWQSWYYIPTYGLNVGYSTGALYAGAYYDANDTSYYADPASTSVFNRLNLVGFTSSGRNYSNEWIEFPNYTGLYSPNNGAHFYPNGSSSYGAWLLQGSRNGYRGIYFYDGGYAPHLMFDGSGNGGIYYESSGRWASYYNHSNNCWGIGTSSTSSTYSLYLTKGVYAPDRIDATIFYDANNSGYYLDPASASVLNSIYQVGVYTRNSAGVGYLSGNYSSSETSYTTGPIYSIGGSYNPTSSSFSTMYGIGYAYSGGISIGINGVYGWGMYVCANGTNRVWLDAEGGYVLSTGQHRGTIFYDYDNTGYYVDPASTSNLNNVQIVTLGVGTAASGTTGEIRATNNVTAYYSSDIKFKENVRDIPDALGIIKGIGGKLFDWKDEYIAERGGEDGYFIQKQDFGIIAQDALKHFPVAVRTRPDGSLAVDYEKLCAVAFEAIKTLEARVTQLEAR